MEAVCIGSVSYTHLVCEGLLCDDIKIQVIGEEAVSYTHLGRTGKYSHL